MDLRILRGEPPKFWWWMMMFSMNIAIWIISYAPFDVANGSHRSNGDGARKDFEEHRFALSSGKVDETLELSRENRELLLSILSYLVPERSERHFAQHMYWICAKPLDVPSKASKCKKEHIFPTRSYHRLYRTCPWTIQICLSIFV